jgi:uncharacterized protein YndB with AHSA1/START domain
MGMGQGWSESFDKMDESFFSDREIAASRVFSAPRDRVFGAWVDPDQVGKWWGPHGFTNTIHSMDVRPGGSWRFTMHGPDGTDYKNEMRYVEIERPSRLILDHVTGPNFRMTSTFDEEGSGTRVTVRMRFETAALRDKTVKEFGAAEGLVQNLEKLELHLAG